MQIQHTELELELFLPLHDLACNGNISSIRRIDSGFLSSLQWKHKKEPA